MDIIMHFKGISIFHLSLINLQKYKRYIINYNGHFFYKITMSEIDYAQEHMLLLRKTNLYKCYFLREMF